MFWLRRTKHRYPTPGELTRPSARNTFTLGSTFYHTVFLSQQVTAGHSRSALHTSLLLLPAMPPKSSYYSLFLGGIPAAAAHSDVRDWIWSRTGLEVQQIQIQRRTADATMGAAFLRFERHTVAAACLEALRGQLMWHHCTSISWSRDSAPWPMVDAATVQATPTSNDAAVQATPGCGDATVQATPDCGDAEVQAGPSYRDAEAQAGTSGLQEEHGSATEGETVACSPTSLARSPTASEATNSSSDEFPTVLGPEGEATSVFVRKKGGPKLKGRAAQVAALAEPMLDLWQSFMDPADPAHK